MDGEMEEERQQQTRHLELKRRVGVVCDGIRGKHERPVINITASPPCPPIEIRGEL
jgi:hypothetical protein